MFCVMVAACALVGILGSPIETRAVRIPQAKPRIATRVTPELAIAMTKACRSLKVLIRHRAVHSTTKQHLATEKPGSADEPAGDRQDRKINRESGLRRFIANQETPGRQSDN